MKNKIIIACLMFLLFLLTGCDIINNNTADDGTVQYEIYQLAADGGYSGTYEEWLSSIKGEDGIDGREINLQLEDGYIRWQYVGDDTWTNLISIESLTGEAGATGETGAQGLSGIDGLDGSDGKEVEFSTSNTAITWRYVGDSNWNDLIALSAIKGATGATGASGATGKSAYELYKDNNPEYTKSAIEWLDDLVNGRLATTETTKYTITFDSDNGSDRFTQEVEEYGKVIEPDVPSRTYYIFDGWYCGTEKWSFIGYSVTEDITLTAKWIENTEEFEASTVCEAAYNNILSTIPEVGEDQIELVTTDEETGVQIEWSSSNDQIITSTGEVIPDSNNNVITLTANMSYGDYTCAYTFEVKVSRYYVDTTKGTSSGYFYLTNSEVSQTTIDTLDIFYTAFGSVSTDGTITSPGTATLYFVNNYLDEIHDNGGYVVVSFNNYTSFSNFSSTATGRENFASSCVEMLNTYDIDGIDIDWESSVDADDYTLMIKELNKQVKANNANHLVVSTVGGGPWAPSRFNTSEYIDDVDLLNLMTYDMQVGYSRHQGALYAGYGARSGCSVDETVSFYSNKGVPLNKMVVGIAFYGRQYDGSEGLSDGGTVLDDITTAHSYSYLATNYLNNASEASSLFFDDECGVPYIFNSTTGVFITYENNQSIRLKCQYVKDNEMAGVMFWQYSQDNGDLIDAISDYQTLYKK